MEWVKCDFCGSADYRVKYRVRTRKWHPDYLQARGVVGPSPPEAFSIVACCSCGLTYVNPRYSRAELREVYLKEQYTDRSGYFSGSILFRRSGPVPRVELRGEEVESPGNIQRLAGISRFKKGGKILDIGCCNGSLLALLERRGWETYGLDFSSTAIQNARRHFGQERAFCGELLQARYPDAFFDVVTLYNTLEHLPNPGAILAEVRRISKMDALLVVQTHDCGSLNAKLFPRSLFFPAQHLYYFRKRDLAGTLSSRGYDLVESNFHTIGATRFGFYLAMHWWANAMVHLHRKDRRRWAERLRRWLVRASIIFDEEEELKRLKMVGATNIPAFRAERTYFFLRAQGKRCGGAKAEPCA